MLRRPESDPRAEGGMFSRLMGLLQALASGADLMDRRASIKY